MPIVEQESKKCSKCGEVKSLDSFYKNPHHSNNLRSACKECEKEYSRQYRKDHKEQRRKYNQQYIRQWRKNNRVRAVYACISYSSRRKNLECCNYEEFKKWYEKQPKICDYCKTPEDKVWILNEYYGKFNGTRLEIDRKDSRKGYTINNICLACRPCNHMKTYVLSYDEAKKRNLKNKHQRIIEEYDHVYSWPLLT